MTETQSHEPIIRVENLTMAYGAFVVQKDRRHSQQEQQVGHAVANALAKRLVSDIQNMGLYAERAAGPVPPTGIEVLILGQLVSIDEGVTRRSG